MVIIKNKICMKNNTFEENVRTKETADEALSESEKLLKDIANIFNEGDYTLTPFLWSS